MRKFLAVLIIISFSFSAEAQDKHFTQFYSSPLTLNPALTGAFDGRYRIGMNYRDQWRGVLDQPFRTVATSLEVKFPLQNIFKFIRKDNVGIGLLFFSDKVTGIDYNTTQIALSLSYHKSLDDDNQHYLMLGFQGGISQRNVNYNDFTFEDQFNGLDLYSFDTNEVLPGNNYSFGDYNVGLNYSYALNRKLSLFLGGAYHHIFRPDQSFYSDDDTDININPLYSKISSQLSFSYSFNNQIAIIPRALFMLQGSHMEMTAGSNVRISVSEYSGTAIQAGVWLRSSAFDERGFGTESLIGMLGLEINGILIGLSYDANLADLSTYNQGQGAFELSIAYLGEYDSETILCPKF